MKFIDEVEIDVTGGHGGSGARHFRREKFVPLGGPDGGNGGHGGSVILRADKNVLTLLDFRHQPRWVAENGKAGHGSRKDGRAGEDLIIKVPVGTEVLDQESGELICDLDGDNAEYVIAKGGRGGKGNAFFKSPTNRAPEHFQPGEEGQQRSIKLSLKLVADVGIIGLPNAGKSTLISRISAARPKIADYPFTTLVPNLSVVKAKGGYSFVVADIPGLIPGAHQGKGLGIKFLKHIERTRLLLHLIDINQFDEDGKRQPLLDVYEQINFELRSFSQDLAAKPQLVVLTKIDAAHDRGEIKNLLADFEQNGIQCMALSSVTGEGVQELIDRVAGMLRSTP